MNRIVITHYQDKRYIIFLRDGVPVKIRVLNDDNFYPDAVYVGCVRDKKDNIGSSFVSYGNKQFGFLKKNDIKPGTLLPVIVKKQTDGRKEDVLTDNISLCGVYAVVYESSQTKPYDDAHAIIPDIKFSTKLSNDFKHKFIEQFNLRFLNSSGGISSDINEDKPAARPDSTSDNDYDCADASCRYSVIIRSNAVNADFDSIFNEYEYLSKKLIRIESYANNRTEGTLLYQGLNEFMSYIASENFSDYEEILTDDKDISDELEFFLSDYKKEGINVPVSVRLYTDNEYPLCKLISMKKLLADALYKKVFLKSNAYITIEHTEAMTVIDVNTSTTSHKGSKADVIHSVNLEAAEEIVRQLKLRNLSGIIIIDFINEYNKNSKDELICHIKKLLKNDDCNAKFVSMTKLGLIELTRTRKSKPLYEYFKK